MSAESSASKSLTRACRVAIFWAVVEASVRVGVVSARTGMAGASKEKRIIVSTTEDRVMDIHILYPQIIVLAADVHGYLVGHLNAMV
jgi:hypothetical protein